MDVTIPELDVLFARIESLENLIALYRADFDEQATKPYRANNQAALALIDAIERFHAIVNPPKEG